MTQPLVKQLHQGLHSLKLQVSTSQQQQLLDYVELLAKWNKAYNLTAIHEPESMVALHLLDSLSVAPYVTANRVLDVATGAGLPGIPLAITHPEQQFVLLDSLAKRTHFLKQVCFQLGLHNVMVVNQRVETFQDTDKFAQIISRAFTSVNRFCSLTRHLLQERGQFLAMKGIIHAEELDEIHQHYTIVTIHPLSIPHVDAERHLVILEESHSG